MFSITALRCTSPFRLGSGLHGTSMRAAITNFQMPAMSPTMTEGGIAQWKKQEGDTFTAGQVLLEIETDKATIDVEAQDDGVLGKILVPDGTKNIPVGQVIAILAEEGDDLTKISVPDPRPPPTQSPTPPSTQHTTPAHISPLQRPLFPSVQRLLHLHHVSNPESIKGTGIRGMLTRGDVLAFLGLASSPTGTFKGFFESGERAPPKPTQPQIQTLSGDDMRRLIVNNLLKSSLASTSVPSVPPSFESIIADYLPSVPTPETAKTSQIPKISTNDTVAAYFDGLI